MNAQTAPATTVSDVVYGLLELAAKTGEANPVEWVAARIASVPSDSVRTEYQAAFDALLGR
ncbi:hypothetical protein [Rhodococcus sp. JS3073]|uniref:hypothetical protein n=1 Tax=Rhodococcus sp. JS3073 TaxID=3002901 RepID=UPI002286A6C6|nr:hypothetical protein [Rhodococcus sp. JS3073]WAM17518.1 hypothetical protein OYT95_13135 [Rhodococcus sp. JS3073]